MPNRRRCTTCGVKCFPKEKDTKPYCRSCKNKNYWEQNPKFKSTKEYRRDWALRKKYSIDLEDFDTLWFVFKGKCAICSVDLSLPEGKRGQSLTCAVVDHDHTTGNLRGLLCNGCNKGLGLFGDIVEKLNKAKEYLELCRKEN